MARLLIDQGADVDKQTKRGNTPLHLAALTNGYHALINGHLDVARLLIDKGADVDKQTKSGKTPLYHASSKGHQDVARLLIDKGADVDKQTKSGKTPLHHASSKGHQDVARLLIDQGADVDKQTKSGKTPLHAVLEKGHLDVAWLLIEARAKNRWLAFAMGFHERLGAQSRVRQLLDKELVEMILNSTSEPSLLQLRTAIKCVKLFPTPSCTTRKCKASCACCEFWRASGFARLLCRSRV